MKYEFSVYKQQSEGKARTGALFKFHFEPWGVGYADCHPWPSLGDFALAEQLERLGRDQLTPLLSSSLYFAKLDAQARASETDLLKDLTLPKTYLFLGDAKDIKVSQILDGVKRGFSEFKSKVSQVNSPAEILHLNSLYTLLSVERIKLRLDFNEQLNEKQAFNYFSEIDPVLEFITLVEDPTPYDPVIWKNLSREFSLPFALDAGFRSAKFLETNGLGAAFLIHKPAVQNPEWAFAQALRTGKKLIVTHYLDHPFGQACASWTAAQALQALGPQLGLCGLRTGFESGLGFGHDEYLSKLEWKPG